MSDSEQSGISRRALSPTLRLYVGSAAEELRAVPVDLGMLTIGRRPYNDLPLDDLTVSGEHAMLRWRNDEFVIYDLNSRNGTLVNGLPIQHRVLIDGDIIDIGIYRLRFEAPAAADGDVSIGAQITPLDESQASTSRQQASTGEHQGPAREHQTSGEHQTPTGENQTSGAHQPATGAPTAETQSTGNPRTMPAEPQSMAVSGESSVDRKTKSASSSQTGDGRTADDARAEDSQPAPTAAAAEPQASIEHMSGPQAGHRQTLERTINRIGGTAEQVAVISRRKGGFFITHLEGLTFPQVNGELIGLTAHRLSDGDLIELAGAMLRFRLEA